MSGRNLCFSLAAPLAGILFLQTAAAQVDVSSFGAKGDGKTDDTAAIQQAINSIPAGQTLLFGKASNTYLISSRLILKPNRTYRGAGTILMSSSAPAHTGMVKLPYSAAYNVTISGISFDANGVGGGIQIAVDGGGAVPATGITLQNTVIRNTNASPAGPWDSAVYAPVGLIFSSISNNQIVNCAVGFSVTNASNLNIFNNSFQSIAVGDAIQIVFIPAPFTYGKKIQIRGNSGQQLGRMAIELWPNGGDGAQTSQVTGTVIDANTFSDWSSASTSDAFGISVMAGEHAIVQNNKIIGGPAGYGIELGAPESTVEQNTIQGFSTGIILHDSHNSTVSGNLLVAQNFDGIEFSNAPGSHTGITISNNSIINAQTFGIYSNTVDWGGANITGNLISRSAGAYAADATQSFIGLAVTPPSSPITVSSNMINQSATAAVPGFSFTGIKINGEAGANDGSTYQSNSIGSPNSNVQTVGLWANAAGSLNGTVVQGNSFNNLKDASAGGISPSAQVDGNLIYNCQQLGPLFAP